jgi:Tol biopolymer transport system component
VVLAVPVAVPPTLVTEAEAGGPAAAGAAVTTIRGFDLPSTMRVGAKAWRTLRVSGPIGRTVLLQHRVPAGRWHTAVQGRSYDQHLAWVSVAVTTPGGRLVWLADEGDPSPWTVAARTNAAAREWRVRVPAVPGWTSQTTAPERVEVVRFPLWLRRVSVSSTGVPGNRSSSEPSINGSGKVIAFGSAASNLVRGDTNGSDDVFVRNLSTGRTSRVSVTTAGRQGNGDSWAPSISDDGRYVAFLSSAPNLVRRDTNGVDDVFVRDRVSDRTTRVSISSAGRQNNRDSYRPAISADGMHVVFSSDGRTLVPSDTNGEEDVFVRDRGTDRTVRVSVSSAERQANRFSLGTAISATGRYVAFESRATTLAPGDTNASEDVFVRDRTLGTTTRVSVSTDGRQGDADSGHPCLSDDGRYVAFLSEASTLVPSDTNGWSDVFVHDRVTGTTSRVSLGVDGRQLARGGTYPAMTGNGRLITFQRESHQPASVAFVYDRMTGRIRALGHTVDDFTADGTLAVFGSNLTFLVEGDTNKAADVLLERLR